MKRILLFIAISVFTIAAFAAVIGVQGRFISIISARTTVGPSDTYQFTGAPAVPLRAHKANVIAGTGTATVTVEANDNLSNPWMIVCTLSPSNSTPAVCVTEASWPYMRHNITANASVVTVTSTISE